MARFVNNGYTKGTLGPKTLAERFWAKVNKTAACWEWTAATNGGYGTIKRQYGDASLPKYRRANRVSYELHYGPIPEGLHVLHTCDNPRCVRPDHLFLGTDKDNSDDKIAKGRYSHGYNHSGESHANSKLNNEAVKVIRFICSRSPRMQSRVAKAHGVTPRVVSLIMRNLAWKSVP